MDKCIAFDIGGTYVKYGVVGKRGGILEHNYIEAPGSLHTLLDAISTYAAQHHDIAGIAISSPGAVSEKGIVYGASALDYLHGPNIKQLIANKTGLPVYMENDANCAASAEMWAGAAQHHNDFIMMVIGTGIGGAIVKDKKIHKGAHLHGGEFGYMLFNDYISNGWTKMDSTASMIRNVEDMKEMEKGSLTGEEIFRLAASGDQDCIQAINRFYRLLAIGIFNLQYIYDPEIILIGGGISSGEGLITNVERELNKIFDAFKKKATIRPQVKLSRFRQHANLLGAVYGFWKEDK